jgi:hypothetical protein
MVIHLPQKSLHIDLHMAGKVMKRLSVSENVRPKKDRNEHEEATHTTMTTTPRLAPTTTLVL